MKITLLSIITFFLSANMLFSQKALDPTAEDIQLAKSLREKYSKDDVAVLESKENITFELNKSDAKVVVKNSVREVLMNINHRADINKYEFYDSESSIESFILKYRNQKNTGFEVKDQFYKDKDLFYNDARVKYMDVDFPVQGYTYIYELEKKYNDIKYFTSLYFNDEFPVIKKEITVTVPDWLNLELKEFNFEGNTVSKTKTRDDRNGTTIYTYVMENVDALYKEKKAPGRSYIYPHVLVIAKSFKHKDKETALFSSTADLYKWNKALIDSMKDDTSLLAGKVKELTSSAKTDEEKIKNIYYWVQDNIRYIAFEDGIAGFKPDEAQNVFEKRYGDCKGMANLSKQMLKLAGFDARLTWIGTKHISYDYTTPSLAINNHMICTLFYKGKTYFIDGTEKYNSFGEDAERIQNKEVMIEDGDKFIIKKVPASGSEVNKEIYNAKLIVDNDKLSGSCSKTYSGESKTEFLNIFNSFENNKKGETLEKYLSGNDKNITASNIKTSDLKNRDLKLSLNYDLNVQNKVSKFDNDIFIDLAYMDEYKNFEFKDRKTNYELNYKTDYESNVVLAIPDGYKLSKLPENLNVNEEDFSILISFKQVGKEIVYKKQFVFKNAVVKTADMAKWNDFNKNLKTIYNQQIIFTKS
ncbi:transglutaminase-like putative cysteine protease [Flavobacterium sp. 2755]|uniref:transglutaminase domain-containing protein n=1 Tax=Flavobacterium sp. 2755 TaxID=2817765 RepID=UPI00285964ED|nr:transglutaminase domain-containing protein [Flavobacterium sp. 2755]MDR6761035.1 transglutaminase-like putative cysteine protease [Flavobacterium sp. 2755]